MEYNGYLSLHTPLRGVEYGYPLNHFIKAPYKVLTNEAQL